MPKVVWSRSAGRRGRGDRPSTVVRVFERADSPGRLYMERCWIDGPGRVRALDHGTPRDEAEALANFTAAKRELLISQGKTDDAPRRVVTLFPLLERYHNENPKAKKWSVRHRKEQERCRGFWKIHLGDVPVTPAAITEAQVETIAQEAAEARGWTPRTEEKHLKYIAAATRWGRRKARLYPVDPLEGLDLPEVRYDTRKRVFTPAESRLLALPDPKADWRITLAFALSLVHGRRISAILHLWVGRDGSDVEPDMAVLRVKVRDALGEELEVDRMFLHYRPEFDKGGLDEWVPVPDWVRDQIEDALKRPMVQESGWLFPEGREAYNDARDKPLGADAAIKKLHKVEEALGIEPVAWRGFHGAKRLHVTRGLAFAGGDATIVGDITGNLSEAVLKGIYRQKDLGQMVRQVDGVSDLVMGSGSLITDRNTDREKGDGEAAAITS